ncbi:MAG: type II toxin-antitoxin system RelE/ParE family toxin [Elusimicrobia bacterium]|nr:type II toxin-antitoxin system RelE/ParE family toxin [Elusimicrobiota bacterium]
MSYRIEFIPSAARAFKKLDQSIQERLRLKIDALTSNPRPHGIEKLTGTDNRYRIRMGDYRIIYVIQDNARLVVIAVIAHRREVYR